MTIRSTSSASKTREWSKRARFGHLSYLVVSLMRLPRSNQRPQLSAPTQFISRGELSHILLSFSMSLYVTTTVMSLSWITMISPKGSQHSTSQGNGVRSSPTPLAKSTWQLAHMMTPSTSTRSLTKASTACTGPSTSCTPQPSLPWTGPETPSS